MCDNDMCFDNDKIYIYFLIIYDIKYKYSMYIYVGTITYNTRKG